VLPLALDNEALASLYLRILPDTKTKTVSAAFKNQSPAKSAAAFNTLQNPTTMPIDPFLLTTTTTTLRSNWPLIGDEKVSLGHLLHATLPPVVSQQTHSWNPDRFSLKHKTQKQTNTPTKNTKTCFFFFFFSFFCFFFFSLSLAKLRYQLTQTSTTRKRLLFSFFR